MHNAGLEILGVQQTKEVKLLEIASPKTMLTLMQYSSSFMSFQMMPTANSSHFFFALLLPRHWDWFTRIWPRQRDAFCIRNWEWGPFWLCAEKQDVPPTNEGSDHNTKVQSDIVAADILQSNIQLTGDTDLVPEVEDINKDMDAIEEQLLEQSASTQQQNSQVSSFI